MKSFTINDGISQTAKEVEEILRKMTIGEEINNLKRVG
jgi:hypothetical protein